MNLLLVNGAFEGYKWPLIDYIHNSKVPDISWDRRIMAYYPILFFCNIRWILKKIKAQKSFLVIPTALQYKPLLNINRSEKWGKINTNRGL